jgi:NAD(P) transhydrogenase subunit beta
VDAQTLSIVERLGYVLAGSLFVVGLHRMNHPATARSGNQVSAAGMILAVAITVLALATGTLASSVGVVGLIIVGGVLIGGGLGLWLARSVQMTAIPQLVSLFNAVGGGAAALVAIDDFVRLSRTTGVPVDTTIFVGLGAVIGSVTFSGSLIASGKLQGIVPSRPLVIPGGRFITVLDGLVVLGGLGFLVWQASQATGATSVTYLALALVVAAALIFGITMVLPIGGADMPVVISLLNSFTGTAAAMAGFVIGNQGLIIAGALVGASGGILTRLMAQAMNRSIANIVLGGFGTGDTGGPAEAGMEGTVRQVGADDVAVMLAYAHSVIIVPGYGLAVAQAQHQVQELAELLEARGVDVKYAIHPVAGRMPGHMNVLLA